MVQKKPALADGAVKDLGEEISLGTGWSLLLLLLLLLYCEFLSMTVVAA